MKCFFASVECAERGLNPFETNLVVADESRGNNALCLAISPKMKTLGCKNRCRMSEIPKNIRYMVAKPRMKKYIEYAADIYDIYLDYIDPNDIHVYSIDEAFIDATPYLKMYKKDAREFAKFLINQIATRKHIPAAAGIGTNLYLAKVALDITAKRTKDHIGYLTEELYRETLWHHRPITDFWQIASGTARRLAKYCVYDMAGVASMPEELLYKNFGINAELLIDHAYGRESCLISDIKAYKPSSRSISSSQILFEDYSADKALIVLYEMALAKCQDMMRQHVIANTVSIRIVYSRDIIPATGGAIKMRLATNLYSSVKEYVDLLFHEYVVPQIPIRQLAVSFGGICSEECEGYDLFTDFEQVEREKRLEHTVLGIKDRFGKNAVFRGLDLSEGATAIARNKMIGGHNGE
jgi:DNA polymerase V